MNRVASVGRAAGPRRNRAVAPYGRRTGLIASLGIAFGVALLFRMAGAFSLGPAALRLWLLGALGVAAVVWAIWVVMAARARKRISEDALLAMDPATFEQHIAALFARAGFLSSRVGASGDGGVDVRVWHRGRPGIVQCKRYRADRAIGPSTIRELVGARAHERVHMAWLATTGRITHGARQLAAAEGVTLLDAAALAAWETRLRSRRLV